MKAEFAERKSAEFVRVTGGEDARVRFEPSPGLPRLAGAGRR